MKRTPLKRNTPLKRAGKLNPVSKKRSKQLTEYSKLRKQFLKDHSLCSVSHFVLGKTARTTEIHHINHREGERLNDTTYWLACSSYGHNWIHDNPLKARELGWLL